MRFLSLLHFLDPLTNFFVLEGRDLNSLAETLVECLEGYADFLFLVIEVDEHPVNIFI